MYWNNYGMQTPYSNPYGQTMQQALQPCSITKVSGENGAKAFGMAPNSSALLLDETAPLVWLKTTDGAGYPTLTPYTITPYQAAPPVDVNSLENRVKRLEEMYGVVRYPNGYTYTAGPSPFCGCGGCA